MCVNLMVDSIHGLLDKDYRLPWSGDLYKSIQWIQGLQHWLSQKKCYL